jgi:hypothetical protein
MNTATTGMIMIVIIAVTVTAVAITDLNGGLGETTRLPLRR